MTKIILLGLPGAGKGTQGKKLADHCGVRHISLGDVVRDHVAHGTPLGAKIRTYFSAEWRPLADDLSIEAARKAIAGFDGFVLDGFPRNAVQARAAGFLGRIDAAVFLRASDETCRARVLARGRSGDAAKQFEARLMAERERMPELVECLRSRYRFLDVDAEGSEEVIFTRIHTTLKGGSDE